MYFLEYDLALYRIYSALLTPLMLSSSPPQSTRDYCIPVSFILDLFERRRRGDYSNYNNSEEPSEGSNGNGVELSVMPTIGRSDRTNRVNRGDDDDNSDDDDQQEPDLEAPAPTQRAPPTPPPPPRCCFSMFEKTPKACLVFSHVLSLVGFISLLILSLLHSTYVLPYNESTPTAILTPTSPHGTPPLLYTTVARPDLPLVATYDHLTDTTTPNPLYASLTAYPSSVTVSNTCLGHILSLVPFLNTTSSLQSPTTNFPPFNGRMYTDGIALIKRGKTLSLTPLNETSSSAFSDDYNDFHTIDESDYDYLYAPLPTHTLGSLKTTLSHLRKSTPVYVITVTEECLAQKYYSIVYDPVFVYKDVISSEDSYVYYDTNTLLTSLQASLSEAMTSAQALSNDIVSRYSMWDTVIVNSLTYTKSPTRTGYVVNIESAEAWGTNEWQSSNIILTGVVRLYFCILIVISYFLISTTTALLVRTLTVSGVAIIYPPVEFLMRYGVISRNRLRTIHFSYPWLGSQILAWQSYTSSHPRVTQSYIWAVVMPHLTKLFIFYILYELSQTSLTTICLQKSYPANFPVSLLTIIMITEYYSQIFIRTAESTRFVPRAFFMLYALVMSYFHYYPYSFSTLSTLPYFIFLLSTSIYAVVVLELPKYKRGIVCETRVREIVNRGAGGWGMYRGVNERLYVD
jgi:hypothetical protein